jgi:hypothetical protein
MRRVAYLSALAACFAGCAAQAAILEEFSAEDWSGFALTDDSTGRLTSCAVYSNYQNGTTLFFVRHLEGGWVISLTHASWSLKPEASYPVRYRVDREAYADGSALALDVDQMGLALRDDDPLIAQIRHGSLLNVVFEGREFGFDLKNSGRALSAADDCTKRHRDKIIAKPEGQSNPVAPAQADLPPPAVKAEPPEVAGPQMSAAAATARVPERQEFGPWVVAATRDGSGNFLSCTAFGVHGGDQLILSYHPDEAWDVSLYRDRWALGPDQSYLLTYNVDGAPAAAGAITRPVESVEPKRVLLELERGDNLIDRIEAGRELSVELRGGDGMAESFRYDLDQAGPALAATRQCTRRNAQGT